jgi:hypothetical protein
MKNNASSMAACAACLAACAAFVAALASLAALTPLFCLAALAVSGIALAACLAADSMAFNLDCLYFRRIRQNRPINKRIVITDTNAKGKTCIRIISL